MNLLGSYILNLQKILPMLLIMTNILNLLMWILMGEGVNEEVEGGDDQLIIKYLEIQ